MKNLLPLRWGLTTLLVIAALGVLVRLGIWQLDRLEWRKAFNERVTTQLAAPVLNLNHEIPLAQLYNMEYRSAKVTGEYVHEQEVLLRNQVMDGKLGFRLLTPLKIEGTDLVVLVDRGWIPFENAKLPERNAFAETGLVKVQGMIRRPQEKPEIGGVLDPTLTPGETRLDAWFVVNLRRIQEQTTLELLPVWVQQAPDSSWVGPPHRALPEIEITEGPHLGYAMQWFTFAAILAIGYPFFVRHQLKVKENNDPFQGSPVKTSGKGELEKGPES